MKRQLGSYAIAAAVLLSAVGTFAQDAGKASGKKPAGSTPTNSAQTAPKAEGKSGRRLPQFYGKVVDQPQRKQIYAIQESYEADIQKLEQELQALKDRRDAEIRALLRPEQVKEIDQLMADAQAKRKKSVSIPNAATGTQDKAPAAK
jgi:hypothetical protein